MAVYSAESTVVTVMRTEFVKGFDQVKTKCINIPLRRWKEFGRKLDYILEECQNIQDGNESVVQQHIGGGLFVTMSSDHPFMKFSQFIRNKEGDLKPGNKGFHLTFEELSELNVHLYAFNRLIPKLNSIRMCYENPGHNEMWCRECYLK